MPLTVDQVISQNARAAAEVRGDTYTKPLTDAERAEKKLAEDLDSFMILLTTQLQHQDPLDPMDANEFTSQLVEFASVEQQIQQNSNLEALIRAQELTQMGSASGYIGKYIEAESDLVDLRNGVAEFNYVLLEEADSTLITIQNLEGQVVFSREGETEAGKHGVVWDGKDLNDQQLEDGTYKLIVRSLDADGEPIDVRHTIVGHVSGASFTGDEPTLFVGNAEIPLDKIIALNAPTDQTLKDNDFENGEGDGDGDGDGSSDDGTDSTDGSGSSDDNSSDDNSSNDSGSDDSSSDDSSSS